MPRDSSPAILRISPTEVARDEEAEVKGSVALTPPKETNAMDNALSLQASQQAIEAKVIIVLAWVYCGGKSSVFH